MALRCSQSSLCSSPEFHLTRLPRHILVKTVNIENYGSALLHKQLNVYPKSWHSMYRGRGSLAVPSLTTKSKRPCKPMASASIHTLVQPSIQVAGTLFTLGTAFVVPFYTIMILAPHAKWTRKIIESSIPYVILGLVYLYLLYMSWSPETLQLMFASKYWLPELPGITRMFSNTFTVASAWIHLLAIDLFAGRQVFLDGLENAVETRHSLVLCLLFCPIGILCHSITKVLMQIWRKANNENVTDVATIYS